MDTILLFLSLKHSGEWMAIYNSLQKREKIVEQDITKETKKVKCNFLTLLNKDYCENLKTINKPPFGIYYIGNFALTKNESITIVGNLNEKNQKYVEQVYLNNLTIIWAYQPKKHIIKILHLFEKNNIFYNLDIAKNYFLKYKDQFLEMLNKNMFMSEIWQASKNVDYSNQINERLYCGISKKILIIDDIKAKQFFSLVTFANQESIQVMILKNVYEAKPKKFQKIKNLYVIEKHEEINHLFNLKN